MAWYLVKQRGNSTFTLLLIQDEVQSDVDYGRLMQISYRFYDLAT